MAFTVSFIFEAYVCVALDIVFQWGKSNFNNCKRDLRGCSAAVGVSLCATPTHSRFIHLRINKDVRVSN